MKPLRAERRLTWPLWASLGLHAALLTSLRSAPGLEPAPRADAWSGAGLDVELLDAAEGTSGDLPSAASERSTAAEAPTESSATESLTTVPPTTEPTETTVEPPAPELTTARPSPSPTSAPTTSPTTSAPRPSASPPRRAPSSAAPSAKSQDGATAGEELGASSAGAGEAAGPGRASGAFGAAGLPPGVRDLGTAFTRAIPPAASRDAAFVSAASGELGTVRLRVVLGEEGRVGSTSVVLRPGEVAPPELERLAKRVVALLGGGQFALRDRAGQAGEQTLELSVRIEQGESSSEAAPSEVVRLGFDAPSEASPGRAYFTLGSGLRFEATVRLLGAR